MADLPSWILPTMPKRAADVLDYAARITVSLVAIWAFVEKVGKPFASWRRKRLSSDLREILRPEFDRLERLGTCADRIEVVLVRQDALFKDIDDFLTIARTNTERLDETNELLDEIFHLDRRVNTERRAHIDELLNALARRSQERQRRSGEEKVTELKKLT